MVSNKLNATGVFIYLKCEMQLQQCQNFFVLKKIPKRMGKSFLGLSFHLGEGSVVMSEQASTRGFCRIMRISDLINPYHVSVSILR